MKPIVRVFRLVLGLTAMCSLEGCGAGEEPVLFPISVEGKWGYIDATGKIVIEPQFLKANDFSEGLALVAVAGTSEEDLAFKRKYEGFIDAKGKFVVPPVPPPEAKEIDGFWTYSYSGFRDGLARIHINDSSGMDGFIDRTGKLVVPLKFDISLDFSDGLAFATTWRHWKDTGPKKAGFIDKEGRFVIENDTFFFGYGFSEGRAVVSVRSEDGEYKTGLIDRRGTFVIPLGIYSALSPPVHEAIRAVKNSKVGLLDLNGEIIVPLGKYEQIVEPLEGNIFTTKLAGKGVLIDSKGKQLATVAEAGDVGRFKNGMATIYRDELYGYVDATGAIRIAPQFLSAEPFDNGLARVDLGETKGYIDPQGKFVWRTDRWDEPIRNSVSKPLSDFLPKGTVKALPLSYNWDVENAIVFAADGEINDLRAEYKKRYANKFELDGVDDLDPLDPEVSHKAALTIFRPKEGFIEVFAADGAGDKEVIEGFMSFYACSNMKALRKEYPKKIIGIVIEN